MEWVAGNLAPTGIMRMLSVVLCVARCYSRDSCVPLKYSINNNVLHEIEDDIQFAESDTW
jgi:hypothetical protein